MVNVFLLFISTYFGALILIISCLGIGFIWGYIYCNESKVRFRSNSEQKLINMLKRDLKIYHKEKGYE